MNMISTALSISLDGFVAGAEEDSLREDDPVKRHGDLGDGLFSWLTAGDTPSSINPYFKMSRPSVEFFDEGVGSTGAAVAGRSTYDVSGSAWAGRGPLPGLPLFVVTHNPPDDAAYTFVTDGVESAIEQAREAAHGKAVHLMGASIVQQSIRAGLLDRLVLNLVPVVLGRGVRLLDGLEPGSVNLELSQVVDAPGVTHLAYRVVK